MLAKLTLGFIGNISYFNFGGQSYAVELTDFNVWNRPLSLTEVGEYSSNCNKSSDFAGYSKPELVSWSDLNILRQGNDTRQIRVAKEKLCKRPQLDNFNQNTIFYYPRFVIYDSAYFECKNLRGDLLFPIKSSHIEIIFSKSLNPTPDRFWVPIVKSKQNNSKWIYDIAGDFELEVTFPDFEIPESKEEERCSYYDRRLKKFKASKCDQLNCFFCQIPEDRLIYKMQGDAPKECFFDDKYIIRNNEFGNIAFYGLDGKSIIAESIIAEPFGWKVLNYFTREVEGYWNSGLLYPFGLQNLRCTKRNLTEQIKLTNVS